MKGEHSEHNALPSELVLMNKDTNQIHQNDYHKEDMEKG